MIKADRGNVTIQGNTPMILAEVSTLVGTLYEIFSKNHTKEEAKAMIMESVEIAFMSEDELAKEQKKAMDELKGKLHGFLNDLFEGRL